MDRPESSHQAFEGRRQLAARWESRRAELLALAARRMVGRDDLAPYLGRGGAADGEALRAAWRRFLRLTLDGESAKFSAETEEDVLADEILLLAWWGELRHAMMPVATGLLARRLGVARYLEGDSNRDPNAGSGVAADGALLSAWTSFERHYGKDELDEDGTGLDLESLADHLIRIACNRRQREFRAGRTIAGQAARGAAGGDSGDSALAQHPGSGDREGAGKIVELADDSAYVGREVEVLLEGYQDRPRPLAAIRAYLLDPGRPQAEIAREVGINQSTVSRCIREFLDRVRQAVRE